MAALAHGVGGSLKIAAIFSVLAFVAVLLLVPEGHPARRPRGLSPQRPLLTGSRTAPDRPVVYCSSALRARPARRGEVSELA